MDDLSDQSVKDSCLFSLVQDNVSVDLPPVTNHSPQTCQALSKSQQNFLRWQEPIMLVYSIMLVYLLVQGFGNRDSTKTIAGKPFGRRSVKWWLSVLNLSDAQYINAKLSKRMCDKNLTSIWENTIFNIHLKTWAMWFSNLFIVFSFQFIQLIASCRQSSRVHYRTLTGSILRKLLCQSLTRNPLEI